MDQSLALQRLPLLLAGQTAHLGALLVPGAMGHICVGSPGLSSRSQCRGVGMGVAICAWMAGDTSTAHMPIPTEHNSTYPNPYPR